MEIKDQILFGICLQLTSETFLQMLPVAILAIVYDNVLGSRELSREHNELRERYKALDALNSLQEEVDQYDRPSTLDSQIQRLKVYLVDGEKYCKKFSEDAAEVCWEFKVDRKVLQQKKDDQISLLKVLGEAVADRRQKSHESLQQSLQDVCGVQDEVLDQEREFYPDLPLRLTNWI